MIADRPVPSDSNIWVADMEPSVRYPLYTRGNTGEVFPNTVAADNFGGCTLMTRCLPTGGGVRWRGRRALRRRGRSASRGTDSPMSVRRH